MASRCVCVMRGTRKPLVVELTSSIALLFGAEPSELIPTLWANVPVVNKKVKIRVINVFMELE